MDFNKYNAFLTGPNGVGMTDLGNLEPDRDFWSKATGINDAGQVAGSGAVHFVGVLSFITGANGEGRRILDSLGEWPPEVMTLASGVNNAGQVVGSSGYWGAPGHAFITGPNGIGITDLGTLGGGASSAAGINAAGQVVGKADLAGGGAHAFITGPGGEGMTDLNSLVNLPAGVVLTEATAINDLGQVVAVGVIPEPETYAMLLAGLGLLGFMTQLRKGQVSLGWVDATASALDSIRTVASARKGLP